MKKTSVIMCAMLTVCLVFGSVTQAQESDSSTALVIVGTYMLEKRILPDSTVVVPPEIAGMLTFTEKYRNFNVFWNDKNGDPVSISYLASYKLTDTKYSEECIYQVMSNADLGAVYTWGPISGSSPVTVLNGKIYFRMPLFDEPALVFSEEGMVATMKGVFEDYWVKVK